MVVDATGKTFRQGRSVRQYFIDCDGYPALTTDGRPVHVLVDDQGEAVLDDQGKAIVAAVDVPPGTEVTPSRR